MDSLCDNSLFIDEFGTGFGSNLLRPAPIFNEDILTHYILWNKVISG
jgi:hypothetical protein